MKKILLLSLLTVVVNITVQSQQNVLKEFKNMRMRHVGPAATSGRVTAIDAVDVPGGYILAGTASGGLWKSTNEGITWEPIFDEQPVLGIGAVRIAPSNASIIYVGTGEGNPRNSQTSGKGMYKSLDGGKSWQFKGLKETKTIHRICVDHRDENVVYAGAMGSAWGTNPDRGVFKSTDGGDTWNKILFINDSVGCADLVMDPNNANKLFAAMWQYGRQPWFFNSGGMHSGLHMTLDGGKTWKKLGEKEGLPKGKIGRIGVAIAPSNPEVVYAMIESEKTALYRSNDGGLNWKKMNDEDVDDRPFYYHEFYVDPANENHLIYLHSTVTESIDGGKTWNTMLPYWGVHPDHHAFWWSKRNPKWMIEGNDGGLNISRDGGINWHFAGNLPLGQFYHINYDLETPYNIYGGMQDNGSWKGPGYIWNQGGIIDADWREVLFGDGFDVVTKPNDHSVLYAMYQGGELMRVDTKTGQEVYCKPVRDTDERLRFNWNAAIAINERGLYYGSQFLHYSQDEGKSWKTISPDLTTNDTTRQRAFESGGLTIDATAAENFCTLLSISPAISNNEVIWVGTDDGQVQLTQNHGRNWSNLTPRIKGLPKDAWIPFIFAGHANEGEAFVVANNYRQNDWKPYLFHTVDFGKTWKLLVTDSQVNGHCLSIAQDPIAHNLLFLGTEHGLYVSFDYGKNWEQWKHDYPAVATQDLKIHPIEHDLIIGTFGRAAYILDDIRPLREYALRGKTTFDKKLRAFENPIAYQVSTLRPRGQRFYADSYFVGDNRTTAARINVWFKVEGAKEKKEEKKAKLSLINGANDTIRVMKFEPDTALNVIQWNYDSKGIAWPSRKESKEEVLGGGYSVAPGKYKVVVEWEGDKDSSFVEIRYDPRSSFNKEAFEKGKQEHIQVTNAMQRLNKVLAGIRNNRKAVASRKEAWVFVVDSLKKDLIKEADSLLKSFSQIEDDIFGPEGRKGIQDDSKFVISDLYAAFGYLSSQESLSADNAKRAIQIAETRTNEIVERYNEIINSGWKLWLDKANALAVPKLDLPEKVE